MKSLKELYQFLKQRDSSEWKEASAPILPFCRQEAAGKASQLKVWAISSRKGRISQSIEPIIQRTEPKCKGWRQELRRVRDEETTLREQNWALVKGNPAALELGKLETCARLAFRVSVNQCTPPALHLLSGGVCLHCLSTLTVLSLPLCCLLSHCVLDMWMPDNLSFKFAALLITSSPTGAAMHKGPHPHLDLMQNTRSRTSTLILWQAEALEVFWRECSRSEIWELRP